MSPGFLRIVLLAIACCSLSAEQSLSAEARPTVEGTGTVNPPRPLSYNRDIRPILSNHCFKCHGPDARERKAELRLDISDEARRELPSGATPIAPGKPEASELIARIESTDESVMMPPASTHKALTDREKSLLRRWISEGAEYQAHWSFIPPQRAELPAVTLKYWPRNALDHFVLADLERAGLVPSPEADRTTLLRRLSFDLTGLPPTPAEIDEFILDNSPEAYERVVDRLLASPHFGERLALDWLDAARFADTNGYHIDNGRDMSKWREWVIAAFNENMPFDRFTIEQLAGDLLPDATVAQRIASGFNRNHMINFEGGAIPEEYHTAYIVDRVNTTATVWLGLTVACSQCHDHKYDPITQKDYYSLYAFFNNVPENGLDGRTGNAPPLLKVPSADQERELAELNAAVAAAEAQLAGPLADVDAAQTAWEADIAAQRPVDWRVQTPASIHAEGGATFTRSDDGAYLVTGPNPASDVYTIVLADAGSISAIRIEALPDDSLNGRGPGRSNNGNVVLTHAEAQLVPIDAAAKPTPQKIKGVFADFSQENFGPELAIDDNPASGWALDPQEGKPHALVLELERAAQVDAAQRMSITLKFQSPFAQHQLGRFRVAVTDAADPRDPAALPADVRAAATVAAAERSADQQSTLRNYYREKVSPRAQELREQLAKTRKHRDEFDKKIPTSMVMEEMAQGRDTFLLVRGQYDKRGEQVKAAVPAALPPLPEHAPQNRLGLAQWLVQDSNPLVPRVAVNRYWQLFFGVGLVKTAEDFGSQGELPSHADLLDWLAVEFKDPSGAGVGNTHRWDIKALCRLIVTSAAYRQSSTVSPALLARDPENRLLARAARTRLNAEFIRDQALAVSGLLDRRVGGASVSPYQPPGLWEELAFRADGSKGRRRVTRKATARIFIGERCTRFGSGRRRRRR